MTCFYAYGFSISAVWKLVALKSVITTYRPIKAGTSEMIDAMICRFNELTSWLVFLASFLDL